MWKLAGREFKSRLLLGSARYPSPEVLRQAIEASGAEIVTVSLRRHMGPNQGAEGFWNVIKSCRIAFLPNTAGCRSAQEAIVTARMARELFSTNWIKLETVGDEYTLQPDPFALVEAAGVLVQEGFEVFPYMTEDLVLAERLLSLGCRILMPWGSPIGSGRGLLNPWALQTLRSRHREANLIVDAGIGAPSHAAAAIELGYDGVLLNTAVSLADDPVKMAKAFAQVIEGARSGYEAGMMKPRDFAVPSTPVLGTPFWTREVASTPSTG